MQARMKAMHAQILTNIDDTNGQNIARGSADLICRAVDGVSMPAGKGGIDFKVLTCPLNEEKVKLYLHAETEAHSVKNIESYFIFLKNVSDVDKTNIKLHGNGKLSIPKFDTPGHQSREIDPKNEVVLVVGNKNFSSEEIEKAKDYAKKNGLTYAGECDLTNNDNIFETMKMLALKTVELKDTLEKTRELEKKTKLGAAYVRGATSGTFKGKLPREVAHHVGSFLSPKDAASSLVATRKAAARRAKGEKQREEEQLERPKHRK